MKPTRKTCIAGRFPVKPRSRPRNSINILSETYSRNVSRHALRLGHCPDRPVRGLTEQKLTLPRNVGGDSSHSVGMEQHVAIVSTGKTAWIMPPETPRFGYVATEKVMLIISATDEG